MDLTSNRLFTSVIKSLRNYRDLKQIGVINNSLERSREGLTRVIESSSALFEVRSLEDFFDELIHQSALVMGLGTDLMIVESESGRVIRATGKNGSLRDGDIDDEDLHRLKNLAESRQARQTGNSPMVYHFSGIQGRGHLLVIDNHEIPDDEQLQLLEIFISNGLIVYAKMSLEEESKATQTEMIGLLGDIVEERDYREGELKGHIKRVSEYAIHLAGKLGYSREDLNILVDAVPLHDIGKIGIYDEVLMKPGRLTEEEFEHMKNTPPSAGRFSAIPPESCSDLPPSSPSSTMNGGTAPVIPGDWRVRTYMNWAGSPVLPMFSMPSPATGCTERPGASKRRWNSSGMEKVPSSILNW